MLSAIGIGIYRAIKLMMSTAVILSLAGCGGYGLLPQESKTAGSTFQTYDQVQAAYSTIDPGTTQVTDLPKIGFDTVATPNIEILSYVDVMARFMPSESLTFDRLPKPVQTCIEAQSRCSALVFHYELSRSQREGSIFLDAFGFQHKTLDTGWSAEVILLIQDGHVVSKLISGRPYIADAKNSIHPLGPLENLGDSATQGSK